MTKVCRLELGFITCYT